MQEFRYLLSPFKIGPIEVKNRMFVQAHTTLYADDKTGLPDDRYVEYIREKAKGGFSMVIVGMMSIRDDATVLMGAAGAWDEAVIPIFKKLADVCHEYDCKCICQIVHTGRAANITVTRKKLIAPSPLPDFAMRVTPHQLTKEEIKELVRLYARTAGFAKEAGMDGVELHGGTMYLLEQFYSPGSNIRTDEYGGSTENRCRFVVEVIDAVSEVLGADKVLGIRTVWDELIPGWLNPEEAKQVHQVLLKTGKLHYINCQGIALRPWTSAPPGWPAGANFVVPHAAAIREMTDIAVLLVGQQTEPVAMEKILADGHADMIGMSRQSIADPEFANKVREGRMDEIRNCIHCGQGCSGRLFRGAPISCTQNAAAGRERELAITTASKKKRVMVIGGGPAGMEAARVAALRGHEVVLYEKSDRLGGKINIIVKIPHREEFGNHLRWQNVQLTKLGVKINLNTEATLDTVKMDNPDVIFVATGASVQIPKYPGIETHPQVVSYSDVVDGKVEVGQRVLIDEIESSSKTVHTAIFLADRGKDVTVVTPSFYFGYDDNINELMDEQRRLYTAGAHVIVGHLVVAVSQKTITVLNEFTFERSNIENIDTLIIGKNEISNDAIYHQLKAVIPEKEVYLIGDAFAAYNAYEAIHQGYETAIRV